MSGFGEVKEPLVEIGAVQKGGSMTSPEFIAGHPATLDITDEHIEPDVAPAADDEGGTSDA